MNKLYMNWPTYDLDYTSGPTLYGFQLYSYPGIM